MKKRYSIQEKVKLWRVSGLGDVDLMRAKYVTQSFPRHTHEGFGLGVIERGALVMRLSGAPSIDPVIRSTRSFKDSIKFKVSMGGIVKGLSWSASKVNPATVTNTSLATGTNYEKAATNMKNVPMCVVRFDAPTF